jgi:5S rRNA maturation endonuclease (ribonuclease M5)
MSAYETIVGQLRDHGSHVVENGHGKAKAQCPAHDDGNPSLSVTGIEGQVLMHCHAGCEKVDVLAAVGLTLSGLYDNPRDTRYTYSDGRRVHRGPDKKFRQSGNTKGRNLYRVDRIGGATTVYVVEGEKDVHAVESAGGIAVCSAMGAGKADRFDWTPLRGKHVVVVADRDEPGRRHAAQVVGLLDGIAASVKIVEAAIGKDAADHVAAGKSLDELVPVEAADGAELLGDIKEWFQRFIAVTDPDDLNILSLWTVHTHLVIELYTTPRLQVDSVIFGSGKTTVLDHLNRLCQSPVQAASLSSPALIPRMLETKIRTILLDEIDRSLRPDKPGVEDLFAILNSGYRFGATRPVLVPTKGGGWETNDMPTYAPIAMAGNSPNLPPDTVSRSIRILLMPDLDGTVEDSDWEMIGDDAEQFRCRIAEWADSVRPRVKGMAVELPARCIGRSKEKWRPLMRVAVAAGGDWPGIVDRLIRKSLAEDEAEREAGLKAQPPGMVMLIDLYAIWPKEEPFVPTRELVDKLIGRNPDYWGAGSAYGKPLTETRMGRLITQAAKVTSGRPDTHGPRGYARSALEPVWRRLGIGRGEPGAPPGAPGEPGEPGEPGAKEQPVSGLSELSGCSGLNGAPTQPGDGTLFDPPSTNGQSHDCACGNKLVAPEAIAAGKCRPCRDRERVR